MEKLIFYFSLILLLSTSIILPKAGDLDPTFGMGTGRVTTDFAGGLDEIRAVAIQKDGKIVAAGQAATGGDINFALARYNIDGSLDSSFGTGGLVTTDFTGNSDMARSVTIQENGKIVAAGSTTIGGISAFALARYNTDGSLDTLFGAGGLVTTSFSGNAAEGRAGTIQNDGKIIVVGQAVIGGNINFALARYNTNGSLDTSFGTGGLVTTDFAAGLDVANAVVLQKDGKIIAVGQAVTGGNSNFALARYNTNGSLDTSFGTNGLVITAFSGAFDGAFAAALQKDGKIIAVGQAFIGLTSNFALARYNPDGSLDISFGTNGLVTTNFAGSGDTANAVVIQEDEKIIAIGSTVIGGSVHFALARYNTDGSLDISFGNDGLVTTAFSGVLDAAFAAALQNDGRIVVAGRQFSIGTSINFVLVRYLNDTLTITKKASAENPCPGQNIFYIITVSNTGAGGGTVNEIFIEDVLPPELIFRSAKTSGTEASIFDATTGVWHIPYLRIGKQAILTIKARVGQFTGNKNICNTAITTYSSVDNVTDSSLFESLGISTTEIFSTTECVSTLPVMYENINHIAQRTDCGVEDLQCDMVDLTYKVCIVEKAVDYITEDLKIIIDKLNCLTNFFSATDCMF